MSLTFPELLDKLKREDEVYLLELLNIHSDELVERFVDVVEDMYDEIVTEYGDEEENAWEDGHGYRVFKDDETSD
jgi:hypothetical protein